MVCAPLTLATSLCRWSVKAIIGVNPRRRIYAENDDELRIKCPPIKRYKDGLRDGYGQIRRRVKMVVGGGIGQVDRWRHASAGLVIKSVQRNDVVGLQLSLGHFAGSLFLRPISDWRHPLTLHDEQVSEWVSYTAWSNGS